MAMTPYRLGFRVCDRRYPFLWSGPVQRSGRWNEQGNEPVHYLASSPLVAWAEWLRGQEISEPEDLDGVAAALWAVLIPESWSDAELPEVDLPIEAWCAAKQLAGWACVQAGRPSAELLPFVRHQGGFYDLFGQTQRKLGTRTPGRLLPRTPAHKGSGTPPHRYGKRHHGYVQPGSGADAEPGCDEQAHLVVAADDDRSGWLITLICRNNRRA